MMVKSCVGGNYVRQVRRMMVVVSGEGCGGASASAELVVVVGEGAAGGDNGGGCGHSLTLAAFSRHQLTESLQSERVTMPMTRLQ